MSIYQAVNAFASILAKKCDFAQAPTSGDIFASHLSVKERRCLVKRKVWERLLERRSIKERHCSGASSGFVDDKETLGVALLFETYKNGNLTYEEYIKTFEVIKEAPGDFELSPYLTFLLILARRNSKTAADSVCLDNSNIWRFDDVEKSAERVTRAPFRELVPSIDWKAAINFPDGPCYRSWEAAYGDVEAIDLKASFDYWHRSRALMANECFGSADAPDQQFYEVSFDEFRTASISLLMGCSSHIFDYNAVKGIYSLKPDIYLSGLSHDAVASFSHDLIEMAHSYRALIKFIATGNVELPVVSAWYANGVKELVHRYLAKVIDIADSSSTAFGMTFMELRKNCESISDTTVDVGHLWRLTQRVSLLPTSNSNPWTLVEFLLSQALACSWQADSAQLSKPLILEQYLFSEVMNPLLNRFSLAVYFGLSNMRSQLEPFGISVDLDHLAARNISYWLESFTIEKELLTDHLAELLPLIDALVSAGKAVEFLKLCKPSHYLITLFESSNRGALPVLEFIPANYCERRLEYLAKLELFELDVAELRQAGRRYLEEIRLLIVQAVVDKIEAVSRQLKERDDAIKAQKLENLRLKQEKKMQLRDEQLAESAAHRAAKAAARERERESDREMVRRLAQEDFMRTEFERRLAEDERRRLIEYYAELERQAEWRRKKSEWRIQRLSLAEKRLAFMASAKKLPEPIFDDSVIKVERAQPVVENQNPQPTIVIEAVSEDEKSEDREPVPAKVEEIEANESILEDAASIGKLPLPVEPERIPTPADEPILPGGRASPSVIIRNADGAEETVEILSGRELLKLKIIDPEEREETVVTPMPTTETVDPQPEEEVKAEPEPKIEPLNDEHISIFDANRPASFEVFRKQPMSTLKDLAVAVNSDKPERSLALQGKITDMQKVLTFTELFEVCVLGPARMLSEMTNLAVVEYLRDELDIVGHLSALRRFLLLDAGEFAISVSLPIFEMLDSSTKRPEYGNMKDQRQLTQFFLETTLGNAVRYISSPISALLAEERTRVGYGNVLSLQQDFTSKLKLFRKAHAVIDPSRPFCFDALELTYAVGWPLNVILPQEDLVIYSRVFSFLLEICRVVNMLDGCLQILDDCQQIAKKQAQIVDNSTALSALRLAHHARCLMRFFFTSIQTYLTSHVLRPQWEQLLCQIDKAKSLDDIRKAHIEYLHNLEKRCFLTESTKPFRLILGRLIRCVLEFCAEMKAISACVVSGSGPVKKANVSRIKTVSDDFKSNSRHFVSVAALRVSQFDRLGFLDRLLLQLTFNDYYSCDVAQHHDLSSLLSQ